MFMNKSVADKLRTMPLFEGLDEDIISRVLSRLRFKSYPPGEVVLVEGEIGHSMYFINRGMFKVGTLCATPPYKKCLPSCLHVRATNIACGTR